MHRTGRGDAVLIGLFAIALAVRSPARPGGRRGSVDGAPDGSRPVRFHRSRKRLCGKCRGAGRHIRLTRRTANKVIVARREAKAITDRVSS